MKKKKLGDDSQGFILDNNRENIGDPSGSPSWLSLIFSFLNFKGDSACKDAFREIQKGVSLQTLVKNQ